MDDLLDEMRQCKSVQACIDLALTDAYGEDEEAVAFFAARHPARLAVRAEGAAARGEGAVEKDPALRAGAAEAERRPAEDHGQEVPEPGRRSQAPDRRQPAHRARRAGARPRSGRGPLLLPERRR